MVGWSASPRRFSAAPLSPTIYLGGVPRRVGSAASRSRRRPWPWCMRSCWKPDSTRPILGRASWAPVSSLIWERSLPWACYFRPSPIRPSSSSLPPLCVLGVALHVTALDHRVYAHRTAAIRTKWVMLVLFGLGALALWSGSEAVLPAYIAGMVLSGQRGERCSLGRRLRTLTVGFLTPFYFLRAGTLVSLPALLAAPFVFVTLLVGKVVSKIFGLYPFISTLPAGSE